MAAQPVLQSHRVSIYVPSRCVCGRVLPSALRDQVVKEVKESFCEWYGGYTEIPTTGGWRSPDGTVVEEPGSVIYSFCAGNTRRKAADKVSRLAVNMANRLTQGAVLVVTDSQYAAFWPNTLCGLKVGKNCACRGGILEMAG